MWTIPNILTFLRLLLIPLFVLVSYLPFKGHDLATAGIFLLAAITDWFDGYLARKLKQSSEFGAFLDPVVDKLMVAAALILLVSAYPTWWMTVAAIVILMREISVSALREWMAQVGQHAKVKVSYIGKIKTTIQMIALLILLSQPAGINIITLIGIVALYLAVVLTIWSMGIYLLAARDSFKFN